MEKETVILTCSSLERYVKRAQEKASTMVKVLTEESLPQTKESLIDKGEC